MQDGIGEIKGVRQMTDACHEDIYYRKMDI
jgi:hypothetical protein